jgi:6-phosphogluconolactonase
MGDDGHTASIFPDQMKLLTSENICEVASHPGSGQKRVTLTGKVINNAAEICFLVTGEGKAHQLQKIANTKHQAELLPAFFIRNAHWYIDADAAKLIG